MTTVLLMKAIQAFLQAELADDVTTVPSIHLGFLPQKTHATIEIPEFPFIIIRPLEGQDEVSNNKTHIKLLFGTESPDNDGFMDVLNLMERVRISLLKVGVLDSRYAIERPYKWKFYDEQPFPEWVGEAMTLWTLPTIIQEVEGL